MERIKTIQDIYMMKDDVQNNTTIQRFKKQTEQPYVKSYIMPILILFLVVGMAYLRESPLSTSTRMLSQQKSQQIITFLSYLLDLVSSMANTLKIIFQLTALLFIITDLVNFWNLASIYIFLPIEIPKFAKQILQNVWTQFNQPILSFFNVSFDTVTFKQKSHGYLPQEEYLGSLELDVSEIAFEPMFVLVITGIELIFLTMILRWIKGSFRKLRSHVSKGIKLEDVYMKALPLQKKGSEGNKGLGFLEMILKKNKVSPSDSLKDTKKDVKQSNKTHQSEHHQPMQQSMKKIIDHEASQIITQHLETSLKKHQNSSHQKHIQPHPQLKLMFMIHRIAQKKLNLSKHNIKTQKHWSQTISIDQFQILSALLMSFMPVIFLPLYGSLKNMQYQNLMEKVNDLMYLLIVAVIFVYPFVYLTAKLNSSRKRKHMKKRKLKPRKQAKIKNPQKNLKPKRQRILTEINLKQEVFQTFAMFFMNISIPFTVAITSSPVIFLSINLITHILLIASSIVFYPKKSCSKKFLKYNKTIQLLTFLLYHLCFCFTHVFNQIKETLLTSKYLNEDNVSQIDHIMGVMIIGIFAIGGMHEMLQFLFTIIGTVFKLIYMVLHVVCGGYDIRELQEDMKKYTQVRPLRTKIQPEVVQIKESRKKTIMVREQNQAAPKNTNRSLSQLGIDFEIEIAKNQIIVNKMKLQLLREQEKLYSELEKDILKDIEEIDLEMLKMKRGSTVLSENQENSSNCENILRNKMTYTLFEQNSCKEDKQNTIGQSFPLKKTEISRKRIKKSHSRPHNQLQVKNQMQQ